MKKLFLIIVTAALASTAYAQFETDNIGMYLDPAVKTSWCEFTSDAVVHVYVVGTELTALSCKGVEFEAWFTDGIMGSLTHPDGIDFGGLRDTDHTIGYVAPEPIINGSFVFAEFDLLMPAPFAQVFGYIGPVYHHSLPEALPAYLDGEDPTLETLIPLANSTGYFFGFPTDVPPVMFLNTECWPVVPNADVSFGGVKALFH